MFLNTKSIKNKEDLLTDYLRCEAIYIAVITETWLTNSHMDAIWMVPNGFKKDSYQISAINRIGMKGSRLALIYSKDVPVTNVDQKQCSSFKSVQWRITIGNNTLSILSLYHPPYSVRQQINNSMFVDGLTDYLIKWMVSHRNIIICGDFNIHIDDLNYIEAQIFNNTIEALGLQQYANFESHHAGNTLDLLFTEISSQRTMRTFKGTYISDHMVLVT